MMPLALMISTSVVAREVLEEAGWASVRRLKPYQTLAGSTSG
jgi:hypothetical protein